MPNTGGNDPNANALNQMPGRVNTNNDTNNNNNETKVYNNDQELAYLKSIDITLKELLQVSDDLSQSTAKQSIPRRSDFRDRQKSKSGYGFNSNKFARSTKSSWSGDPAGDFLDSFEKSLFDGIFGSDFTKKVQATLSNVADEFGAPIRDIPGKIGAELGKQAISAFKNTDLGKNITGKLSSMADNVLGNINKSFPGKQQSQDAKWKFNGVNANTEARKSASTARSDGVVQNRNISEQVTSSIQCSTVTIQTSNVVLQSELEKSKSTKPELEKSEPKQPELATSETVQNVDKSVSEAGIKLVESNQKVDDTRVTPEISKEAESKADPLSPIKDAVMDNASNSIKDALKNSLSGFADKFIPGSGSFVSGIFDNISGFFGKGSATAIGEQAVGQVGAQAGQTLMAGAGESALTGIGNTVASGASSSAMSTAMGGISQLGAAAATAAPYILAVVAALAVLQTLMDAFAPAIEGTKKLFETFDKLGNRFNDTQEQRMENAQKRLTEDLNTIIEQPFKILEQAAQDVYDAWDNTIRKINGTQGYNKEDLQDLMGAYANRLREDGLTSVVSGVDIIESLEKVLDSGLSGKVAEEFAYTATKLNAAIPTQDFFGYADTYASLAANAIKDGASESAAISYANEQLELFASNVLYSSRVLSGGFTTGLKDAENLFDESVKIAQTARTNNASEIAGVLTAVAAATGAIAPDLATSLTDAVVNAATGGNSSQLVALRSLAGINASNTEFLQALANDPQDVFTELFRGLADMQNMSQDAYMEVAEGLSEIFGLSMDTFARVDFNYLADAISNMQVNDAALLENMNLLKSGETTTSAEQMRMQQINQYMLDEGLAYVLDNEAARVIQQHMWDEQMKNELMEATYGVELKGAALEFLEGIRQTIDNIINLLNPFAWFGTLANVAAATNQAIATEDEIRKVLELGKVGQGNAKSLYQLTTRGVDLNVAPYLVDMMGGQSSLRVATDQAQMVSTLFSPTGLGMQLGQAYANNLVSSLDASVASGRNYSIDSKYNWGTVGKAANDLLSITNGLSNASVAGVSSGTSLSATDAASSVTKSNLEKMLSDDYITNMVQEGKTYEDWLASGSQFGISDVSKSLSEYGYDEQDVKGKFQTAQTAAGAQEEQRLREREELFWNNTEQYQLEIKTNTYTMIDLLTINNQSLEQIYQKHSEFYDAWVDYFVNHTAYNKAFGTAANDVTAIRNQERDQSESAVYALAEALNKNSVDLLVDPTLQTNALLGQILIVVNAIMQQNNKNSNGGMSLPDSLNALAMGLVQGSSGVISSL